MVELVVVLSTLVKQFLGEREKQWMLKLLTVYPCVLNEKVDICENGHVQKYGGTFAKEIQIYSDF